MEATTAACLRQQQQQQPPPPPHPKTVYLIRHAETQENVCMDGLHSVGNALSQCHLPNMNDVLWGCQFLGMQVRGVTDSTLSAKGRRQIVRLRSVLQQQRFGNELDIIAHSPLQRAKQTCYGVFGKQLSSTTTSTSLAFDHYVESTGREKQHGTAATESTATSKRQPATTPSIIELPCLTEVSQKEIIFQRRKPLTERIQQLQGWMDHLDGETRSIALVGHSEYFMHMLGLDYKFNNCDAWEVEYYGNGQWKNLRLLVRIDDV
jgi:broad specificity phosphatase PhoE